MVRDERKLSGKLFDFSRKLLTHRNKERRGVFFVRLSCSRETRCSHLGWCVCRVSLRRYYVCMTFSCFLKAAKRGATTTSNAALSIIAESSMFVELLNSPSVVSKTWLLYRLVFHLSRSYVHEEAIQDKNSNKKRKLYCTMILMRKVWWMKIVSLEKHATHMR